MSDIDTPRRPGPWDPRPEDVRVATPTASEAARPAESPLDKGQHPVWALISTLLLGGLIYYWSGSLVIVAAVLFGLLVHEYGHVLAMNRLGMGPARIYIVPFLGGLAKGQRMPASEWHGVLVALAGPAFGLLAAIPFYGLYIWSGQTVWLAGVLAIAFINLLNLAPAPPLDGSKALGPVLARIHPMVEKIALLAVGALAVIWGISNGSWLFAGFLAFALFGHLRRGAWRPEGRQLSWGEAAKATGLFLLTAGACVGVGMAALLPGLETVTESMTQGARMFEFGR
jgi:Zn-dependent protease